MLWSVVYPRGIHELLGCVDSLVNFWIDLTTKPLSLQFAYNRQMDNNRNLDDSQEPLFSKQGHSLKENLIQDVYSILVQKNQANIECRRKPRCFSHGKIVGNYISSVV